MIRAGYQPAHEREGVMLLRRFWFVMLVVLLSACFPLPGQREALETEIAGKIYQTLTAAAPPATPTLEFTATPPFTPTPLPSPTPLPQAVVHVGGI